MGAGDEMTKPVLMLILVGLVSLSVMPLNITNLVTVTVKTPAPGPTIGWGGAGINSTVQYGGFGARTPPAGWPNSNVFPGQKASDFEIEAQQVARLGYNLIRFSISPACNHPDLASIFGQYDPTELALGLKIASYYNLWIDVDYHSYNDMQNSTIASCWLNFWKPIVQQFYNNYSKILWEPLNEPLIPPFDQTAVRIESSYYQQWINQTRAIGDTHAVIVENLCSNVCSFGNWTLGFPTVNDPANKVYISLHRSFSYSYYWRTWNNATADSEALRFYNFELQGTKRTGWPVLISEFWTGAQSNVTNAPFPGPNYCPDLIQFGSAGYCKTQLEWVNKFVAYMDNNAPRIAWQGWTIGDWTEGYGCTVLGALSPKGCSTGYAIVPGWGFSSLSYDPITKFSISASPQSVNVNSTANAQASLTVTSTNGFTGNVTLRYIAPIPSGGTSLLGPFWVVVPAGSAVTVVVTAYSGGTPGVFSWTIVASTPKLLAATTLIINST